MSNRPDLRDAGARVDLFLEQERYHDAAHHAYVDYLSSFSFVIAEFRLAVVAIGSVTLAFLFLIPDGYFLDASPLVAVGGPLAIGIAAVIAILALNGRTRRDMADLDRDYITTLDAERTRHLSALRQL